MSTLMEKEARETPELIAAQLKQNEPILEKIAKTLRQKDPKFAITIGRGSSDNACNYAKYLFETQLGLVTSSASPSIITAYNSNLKVQNALVIGISQSGQSPDICQTMDYMHKHDAITIAIVNAAKSPLSKAAKFTIPMHAGEEKAVAATKSFISSLTVLAQFVATLTKDETLLTALKHLPETLANTIQSDHHAKAVAAFKDIDRTFVISRGFGFPIAQEAALKFKETAGIQAEAFSSAEILHGPFALIQKDRPFLLFAQSDETLADILSLAQKIKALGGKTILMLPRNLVLPSEEYELATVVIPVAKSLHPILDPIVTIQAFYLMVAELATTRGFDPDKPQHLNKITTTL